MNLLSGFIQVKEVGGLIQVIIGKDGTPEDKCTSIFLNPEKADVLIQILKEKIKIANNG